MKLISEGKAPRLPQPEAGATYEGIQKKENAKVSEGIQKENDRVSAGPAYVWAMSEHLLG